MRRTLIGTVLAMAMTTMPATAAATLRAYVANAVDGTVSVLGMRGATIATIPVGCEPRAVTALPDGSRVYVANSCLADPDSVVDTVSVIDTRRNAVVATLAVGTAPTGLAIGTGGTRLYVLDAGLKNFLEPPPPASISVVDTRTNAVVTTLALGFAAFDVAIAPDVGPLYVTGPGGVSVIDPDSGEVLDVVAGANGHLAMSPSGDALYVTDTSGTLAIVDLASLTIVATVPIGVAPQGIAVDRSGTRVFVASAGASPNAPPDEVTVVDPRAGTVLARLDGGDTPVGVALAGRRLLVTNYYTGSLRIMKAATGRIVGYGRTGLGAANLVVVDPRPGRGKPAGRGRPHEPHGPPGRGDGR
jgi:YVTN family beta-propeller protein